MKLKDIKDYLIAREMFGSNTKEQCKIVKKLKEKEIIIEELCEGWSEIRLTTEECGWVISNELLEN
jgi:hypothetical protein